jgi:hypothetical protein
VPLIVIDSVKIENSAENSTAFLRKLAENRNRIEQATGNDRALIAPNLASINILKGKDGDLIPGAFRTNTSSSEFFAFELRQLIDSKGNRVENLSQQPWKISGPEVLVRDGLGAQKYVASGLVNVTSKSGEFIALTTVEVIVELFSEVGSVKYGSSSIRVFPGSVKFSYKLSSWPFASVSDRIYLGIRSMASGNGGVYSEGTRLRVGDGFIDTPLIAQVDGNDVPIRALFNKNSSNEAYLLFEFPSFAKSLYYDPVASLSSNAFASSSAAVDSSSTSQLIIFISCGAAAFVLGSAIFGIFLYRKRSRSLNAGSTSKTTQLVQTQKSENRGLIAL